ncbi:MAG: glycosyltransferase family 1 protein [Acidobacteria bacterium]|nr:glycosyltransferase family 1 protein [Acidobacteriota bacterium]
MARVVLACWGSYGDLFPYLAIARRLRALGHEPVLAAPEYYRSKAECEGVELTALRPDVDPTDTATIRRLMDPARGTEAVIRELIVPVVRGAFDDLASVVAGADLVVSHPVTFAAPLAAEAAGVPWISSALAPASFFSSYDFPVLPPHPRVLRVVRRSRWLARLFLGLAHRITGPWTAPVRRFRRELGLPPAGDPLYEGQFSRRGTLALFSPVFGPPQPDWPAATVATGFVFHRSDADVLPPDLAAFLDDGPPPIVFTLGSSAVGAAGRFYEESVAAVRMLHERAVLLVGSDPRNRSALPSVPDLHVAEYVPHWLLFPRAAAIVHHGGIGTTAQALAAGRPMLVVPHAHDQPDNAHRAERLGVARVVDAARYARERVVSNLRALRGAEYVVRAQHLGCRLAAEDGLTSACQTIERTLAEMPTSARA